jgi:hypothetical protein
MLLGEFSASATHLSGVDGAVTGGYRSIFLFRDKVHQRIRIPHTLVDDLLTALNLNRLLLVDALCVAEALL